MVSIFCVNQHGLMWFFWCLLPFAKEFWKSWHLKQQGSRGGVGDPQEQETADIWRPLVDVRLQPSVSAPVWRRFHVRAEPRTTTAIIIQSSPAASPGTPCMWFTAASGCRAWCAATSGRAPTWWTALFHGPPRKRSSPFSWPPHPPSACSSTWQS